MFHLCRDCAACHPFPDSDIENASVVSQGILGYGIAYVEARGAGRGGGGRRLAYAKGRECLSDILNYTPKRDRSGRDPSFYF